MTAWELDSESGPSPSAGMIDSLFKLTGAVAAAAAGGHSHDGSCGARVSSCPRMNRAGTEGLKGELESLTSVTVPAKSSHCHGL